MAPENVEPDEVLRRPLVALLHVAPEEYTALQSADPTEAFEPLREVRSELTGFAPRFAALTLAVPPFLRRSRLRATLAPCLTALVGRAPALSLRILAELVETLEAAEELSAGEGEGTPVLAFTDEEAVGDLDLRLLDLRRTLAEGVGGSLLAAFPLSHYDVLCRWQGAGDPVLWGPDVPVARAYSRLTGHDIGVTARGLEDMDVLRAFLEE